MKTAVTPISHRRIRSLAEPLTGEGTATRFVAILSTQREVIDHVQQAVEAIGIDNVHAIESLDNLPPEVADPKVTVVFLLDLAAKWPDGQLHRFLEKLSCGGLESVHLIPLLPTGDGYPAEWAAMLHERALAYLSRSFPANDLEALLQRCPRPHCPSTAGCEPMVLHGKTVRFDTRHRLIATMLDDVRRVADHDITVMLIGETGSGKTTLARLFHELSPRRNAPFVHVACGALPASLIESELFGHVRGAFTGAEKDKLGKFELAGDGTLLLDEIDTLDLEQQVKLLKVIETREFEPVGSHDTRVGRARLIVASNVCLENLVEQQRFRQDLYYRLNVLKFELPPLRDRHLDLIPLAMEFLAGTARRYRSEIQQIHPGFFDAVANYGWPGNLRELNHCMERAIVLCRNGKLFASSLPQSVLGGAAAGMSAPARSNDSVHLLDQVATSEKQIIEEVLRRHNFHRTSAAHELGISRVTLYNKMKKYGL